MLQPHQMADERKSANAGSRHRTADRRTEDFGSKLREARERKGVSLREIANATKISVRALEALERNDISHLPGGIFSRSFVRAYAAEAGLDPDETLVDTRLEAGARQSFNAQTELALTVSDPSAIELVVNGLRGRRLGPEGVTT